MLAVKMCGHAWHYTALSQGLSALTGLLLAGADCNCSVPQGNLDIPKVLGGEAVQPKALDCDACWRWGLCFLH